MKMSVNVPSLEAELQMFIFYQSHKSNIHTDENSKARGYIRNNCETQSTHCRIPLHYLISQNNQKKKNVHNFKYINPNFAAMPSF